MRSTARWSSFFRAGALAGAVVVLAALGPAAAAGDDPYERHPSIFIANDSQFDAAHGVRSGSGTPADPYVISGWDVDRLEIKDTSAHVVIADNLVRSTLRLNWNGPGVRVVNNEVGDLRVNENVRRTGGPTSGYIGHNTFGFVGQIRHFDGVFEDNLVKPGADLFNWDVIPFVWGGPAVNFDGFNGARFKNNTIHGPLRAQLHGHHHSSGYGEHSHHHAAHDEMVDHTKRWHEVWITDNVIYSDEHYALSYTDIAHAANDRTAASEQEESLNAPHVHNTRIHLNGNRLIGSGLLVDVFNAEDRRHLGTERGVVEIRNNKVVMTPVESTDAFDYKHSGIEVFGARDVTLKVIGNKILGETSEEETIPPFYRGNPQAGIRLYQVAVGDLFLFDNLVTNHQIGIEAARFTSVEWFVDGLATRNVSQDVAYDETAGPPKRKS